MSDSNKDCKAESTASMPQMHTIPMPESIKLRSKTDGASSYQGKVNHPTRGTISLTTTTI